MQSLLKKTRKSGYFLLPLFLFMSLSGQSAVDNHDSFARTGLGNVKAFAVHVDPPHGVLYSELSHMGLSREALQEKITEKLRLAGIPVVSFDEAVQQSDTALLNLRFRVVVPDTTFYSYNLSLSVKQKAPLGSAGDFYAIGTWSDFTIGAVEYARLGNINSHTLQLVDNFIAAYRAQ